MGYVHVLSGCYRCKRPFTYNPSRVPSVRVDGVRQPVCLACVEAVNPIRVARGLAPIVPLDGAYEAADERDVAWGEE